MPIDPKLALGHSLGGGEYTWTRDNVILYHLGIMQWVVRGVAWVMMRTMRTSGAETLSAAGNGRSAR